MLHNILKNNEFCYFLDGDNSVVAFYETLRHNPFDVYIRKWWQTWTLKQSF